MPLTQIVVWTCEVCAKTEVLTRKHGNHFEPNTTYLDDDLTVGWGYVTDMMGDELACPKCVIDHNGRVGK